MASGDSGQVRGPSNFSPSYPTLMWSFDTLWCPVHTGTVNHKSNAFFYPDCLYPIPRLQPAELSRIRHRAGQGQVRPQRLDMSAPACPALAQPRQLSSWLRLLGGVSLLLAWVGLRLEHWSNRRPPCLLSPQGLLGWQSSRRDNTQEVFRK